jgi:hypothetical protein
MRFLLTIYFCFINRFSRHSVIDSSSDVDVSLTSHGRRIGTAFVAIESIACGVSKPRKIFLYLSEQAEGKIPDNLTRLVKRGLQIVLTRDLGPHTKYYPYVESQVDSVNAPLPVSLVTADDDKIYPRDWLQKLATVSRTNQRSILCYRAKDIKIVDGVFAPYKTWPVHRHSQRNCQLFFTGVSGVLYPHSFLVELKRLGTKFIATCPKADDIWLNFVASRDGVEVVQISPEGVEFPSIPMSSRGALQRFNVAEGGNDESIAALYGTSVRP